MQTRRISHSFIVLFVAVTLILPPGILEASGVSALPAPSLNTASIRLPESLGTVEWIPAANSAKTIFFIQDAHDSLEAQKHIAASIRFLVHHRGVKTVFEEGYEGPVPTARLFGAMPDARARRKVADFLLDRLRLGGAEFAHIIRTRDFKLIGADNLLKYQHNLEAFREAAAQSSAVEEDLDRVLSRLEPLAKQHFPKPLTQWLRWRDRYENGKTKLPDYLRRSVEIASLSEASWQELAPRIPSVRLLLDARVSTGLEKMDIRTLFGEIKILEDGIARQFLTVPEDLQLFGYREALHLLKRLNRLEVTPAEYEASREVMASLATQELADFMARVSGTSLALSREWETRIKTAVDFYEAALQRDAAIKNSLAAFLDNPGEKEAVLVFGGFHKTGILAILKQLGISCALITPKISAPDPVHEGYYRQLMTDGVYDYESVFLSSRSAVPGATRPPSSFIAPFGELTARRLYQAAVQNPEISFALLDRVPAARAEVRPSTVVGRLRDFLKWQVFGNLETSLRDAVILLTDPDPLIQEQGLRAIEALRTYDPMLKEAADDLGRELMVRVHRSEQAPQTAIQRADDIDRRLRASVSVLNDAFDLYHSEMREDLFLPEEIERLRKRVQYLSELYPRLGSESKKTLLYPSFLAAFLLLKPAYFRIQNEHRQEPDPLPLFQEIQSRAPEIWSKLGLTVSEQEIYDVTYSISEIFNHMQFLVDSQVLIFPEDENDLKLVGDLYDQQRFQEFDEASSQFIRKLFQRTEGHELMTHALKGILMGYPEADIAALIEDKPRIMVRGSFEDIGLLAAGRNPDEISDDSQRYLERLDIALHYAYARLRNQPGFLETVRALGLPPDAGHHSELRSTPRPFSLARVDLDGFETDEMLEVYQDIRESMMTAGYEAPPEFDDDPTFLSEIERLQEWSFAVRAKDERIAGFVLNDPEPSAGDGYLEVELLGVDPGHQGEGYGHRLLAASEVLARRLGKKALWLEVNRENQDAIRLYQSYGFRRRSAEGNADYMVMHKKIRLLKNPQRPGDLPGREAPAAFPAPEFFRRPARPSVIRKMRTELRSDERSDPVSRRWIQPLLRQARVRSENFVSTQAGLYVPAPDHFWGEVLAAFPAAEAEPFKVFSAGSGQGIFEVFLAHARPKARIAGVEHEASLLVESLRLKTAAQAAGRIAEGQVEFEQGDFNDPSFAASIAEADYVYYYEGGTKHPETLIHTLMQQMKPGARVVVLGSQLRESDFVTGLEKTGVFIVESDGRPVRVLRRAELRTAGLEEMIATLKMQDLEALSAQGLKTLFMPLLAAVEGQPLISDKGTFFLLALILAAEPVLSSWTVLRILTAKQRKIMKIEGLLEEAARGPQPKRLRSRASLLKILLESLGDTKNPRVQSVADEILKVLVKRVEGLEWFVHDVVRKEIILPGEQPRDAGLAFHPHLFEGRENLRKLMPSDYYEHLYKIGEQQDLPFSVADGAGVGGIRPELRPEILEVIRTAQPEPKADTFLYPEKLMELARMAAQAFPESWHRLGVHQTLASKFPVLDKEGLKGAVDANAWRQAAGNRFYYSEYDLAQIKFLSDINQRVDAVFEVTDQTVPVPTVMGHGTLRDVGLVLFPAEVLEDFQGYRDKKPRLEALLESSGYATDWEGIELPAGAKVAPDARVFLDLSIHEALEHQIDEAVLESIRGKGLENNPLAFREVKRAAIAAYYLTQMIEKGAAAKRISFPRPEMRLTLSRVREFLDRRPHAVWYASYDKQGQETVEYVNPAFAKVYGTTVQDILDKKTYRAINGPEAPVDKFKADDARALKQGIFMGREGNPRVTVVKIRFQGGVLGMFVPTVSRQTAFMRSLEPELLETLKRFRYEPGTSLTQREKRLIRKSYVSGMNRLGTIEDKRPLWMFGEAEAVTPFFSGGLEDSQVPQIPQDYFINRKVLVAPGYGNLPFLIRFLGAREVVAMDLDPVTIAWQKLKWKTGTDGSLEWLFVNEHARWLVRGNFINQWFRALNGPPAEDVLDHLTFKTGDVRKNIAFEGDKYDLIVVPYLFAFDHGLETEAEWDKALHNLRAVLSPKGHIVLLPGKILTTGLPEGPAKALTERYHRWLDGLESENWEVTQSEPYRYFHILGDSPVQAGYSILTPRAEMRGGDRVLPAIPPEIPAVFNWIHSPAPMPAGPPESYLVRLVYAASRPLDENAGHQVQYHVFSAPLYEAPFLHDLESLNVDYRKDYRGNVLLNLNAEGQLLRAPENEDLSLWSMPEEASWLRSFVREKLHALAGNAAASLPEIRTLQQALRFDPDLQQPKELNALSAGQLRAIFLEGFQSHRLSSKSGLEAWQALETTEPKFRVAGNLILSKVDGRWGVLLGQRDKSPEKPFPGFFTVPVGKQDSRYNRVQRMMDSFYRPQDYYLQSFSVIPPYERGEETELAHEAGIRETSEETGILLRTRDLIGRIDDFTGFDGRALIQLFVALLPEEEAADLEETKELFNYQWVPLEILLDSPEGGVGDRVEAYLRARLGENEIHLIPELRSTGLESFRRLARAALAPWVSPRPETRRPAPRIVLFDVDGVLVPNLDSKTIYARVAKDLEARFHVRIEDPSRLRTEVFYLGKSEPERAVLFNGELTEAAYMEGVNRRLRDLFGISHNFTLAEWAELIFRDRRDQMNSEVNDEIRSQIQALRQSLKIQDFGVLSDRLVGDWPFFGKILNDAYPEDFSDSELHFVSYLMKAAKSDTQGSLISAVLARLKELPRFKDLRPDEILFIDDKEDNLEKAKAQGLQTAHFVYGKDSLKTVLAPYLEAASGDRGEMREWLQQAPVLFQRSGVGKVVELPANGVFDQDAARNETIVAALSERLAEAHRSAFEGRSPVDNTAGAWREYLDNPDHRILVLIDEEGTVEGLLLADHSAAASAQTVILKQVFVAFDRQLRKKGALLLDVFLRQVHAEKKVRKVEWQSYFGMIPLYKRYLGNRNIPYLFDDWTRFEIQVEDLESFVKSERFKSPEEPEQDPSFARSEEVARSLLKNMDTMAASMPFFAGLMKLRSDLLDETVSAAARIARAVEGYRQGAADHNQGSYSDTDPVTLFRERKGDWYDLLNNVMMPPATTLEILRLNKQSTAEEMETMAADLMSRSGHAFIALTVLREFIEDGGYDLEIRQAFAGQSNKPRTELRAEEPKETEVETHELFSLRLADEPLAKVTLFRGAAGVIQEAYVTFPERKIETQVKGEPLSVKEVRWIKLDLDKRTAENFVRLKNSRGEIIETRQFPHKDVTPEYFSEIQDFVGSISRKIRELESAEEKTPETSLQALQHVRRLVGNVFRAVPAAESVTVTLGPHREIKLRLIREGEDAALKVAFPFEEDKSLRDAHQFVITIDPRAKPPVGLSMNVRQINEAGDLVDLLEISPDRSEPLHADTAFSFEDPEAEEDKDYELGLFDIRMALQDWFESLPEEEKTTHLRVLIYETLESVFQETEEPAKPSRQLAALAKRFAPAFDLLKQAGQKETLTKELRLFGNRARTLAARSKKKYGWLEDLSLVAFLLSVRLEGEAFNFSSRHPEILDETIGFLEQFDEIFPHVAGDRELLGRLSKKPEQDFTMILNLAEVLKQLRAEMRDEIGDDLLKQWIQHNHVVELAEWIRDSGPDPETKKSRIQRYLMRAGLIFYHGAVQGAIQSAVGRPVAREIYDLNEARIAAFEEVVTERKGNIPGVIYFNEEGVLRNFSAALAGLADRPSELSTRFFGAEGVQLLKEALPHAGDSWWDDYGAFENPEAIRSWILAHLIPRMRILNRLTFGNETVPLPRTELRRANETSVPAAVFFDARELAQLTAAQTDKQWDEILTLVETRKGLDVYMDHGDEIPAAALRLPKFRKLLSEHSDRVHVAPYDRAHLGKKKIFIQASFFEGAGTGDETRNEMRDLRERYHLSGPVFPLEYHEAGALRAFLGITESLKSADLIRGIGEALAIRNANGRWRVSEAALASIAAEIKNRYVIAWSA